MENREKIILMYLYYCVKFCWEEFFWGIYDIEVLQICRGFFSLSPKLWFFSSYLQKRNEPRHGSDQDLIRIRFNANFTDSRIRPFGGWLKRPILKKIEDFFTFLSNSARNFGPFWLYFCKKDENHKKVRLILIWFDPDSRKSDSIRLRNFWNRPMPKRTPEISI